MLKTTLALAVGAVLMTAGEARATWVIQGIPGASCATDSRTNAPTEYRNRKLLNTSTDPWEIAVATCPISLNAPGLEPREYRIYLTDPDRRDSWCSAYSYNGTLVRTQWGTGGSTPITGSLAYPLGWSAGLVEVTFHCLLQSGASIDRIEIHWWKP
jgi:hypothetical protein